MQTTDKATVQDFEQRIESYATDNELPTLPTDEKDAITFRWTNYELLVDAVNLSSDGHAELTFWHDNADYKQLLLPPTRANLLSSSNRATITKQLAVASSGMRYLPWDWIMSCVAFKVLRNARDGEPVQTVWPGEQDSLTPEYLLEPLLYRNHPNVIFGDYGSLKSQLALLIGYVVQLPYPDNGLGLITPMESTHCLYLDYEDDPSSFQKRWGAMQRGFGIQAAMPILYRRQVGTVAESIDSLTQIKKDKDIGLLIVDSLGPAARGNLNDPEPAIKYHEAVRKLGITSLTLAHCAKDQLTRKRTIFGSVFFTNLARSVWECRAEQEPGEDEAIISLTQRKANLSKLHPAFGYRFTFTDNSITVAKADLKDTGLSDELPLRVRIKQLLGGGAMPGNEIAEGLGANPGSVRAELNRMAKDQITVKVGKAWGLKAL